MKVSRRRWITLLAIFGLISIFALAACGGGSDEPTETETDSSTDTDDADATETEEVAEADYELELDFSHFFPPEHFMEDVVQEFITDLEEATDGRIKVTSHPGATLADPGDHFDAAATGTVDFALSVHGYTPGEFPLTSVMELPFMSSSAVEGSNILWQLYEEFDELKEEYAGTVPLWLYTTDPGQLYMTGDTVESIEDLAGKKVRSPSAETSEWLEALGATPVSMPMNENFEALERGVVDGTIAPLEAVYGWQLSEVVENATVGDFYSTTMFVVMNEDVWNQLTEEDQNIILELSTQAMVDRTGAAFDEIGAMGLEALEEKGAPIYSLSEDELAEWSEYINPTIENWIKSAEDKGLPGQAVYDRAVELAGN